MKACVIQPAYSTDFSKSEEYFEKQLELLTKVDENVDIIVLPESADCPCLAKNEDERKIACKSSPRDAPRRGRRCRL